MKRGGDTQADGKEIEDQKILIFAPTGKDGPMTAGFLSERGLTVQTCQGMSEVCHEITKGCDLVILAEETFNATSINLLIECISRQPPWSDLPVCIITSGGEASQERLKILATIGSRANVALLERPFRRGTLLSTVEVALRARRRQHQVRQLLAEREEATLQLENLIKLRTIELTDTNAQLETLVYSIAHDLRAPLRSMQAFSRILLEEYAPRLDQDAVNYAGRIVRSAETMDALVLDLLAYGKAARSDISLESVDLERVWGSAMAQFENDIENFAAVITTDHPLPWVQAHAATLTQILANLLGNALKFVSPGVAPEVNLRTEEKEGRVRLYLSDNGIGISPEYHEKIFRVFERLRNNEAGGTGIGLSIVRKGVERMGGKVGLEPGPGGRGTVFWIDLAKGSAID